MPEQNEDMKKGQDKGSQGTSDNVQVRFEGDPQASKEEKSFFDKFLGISFGRQRVPEEIITSFLRQLVMLLEAGVTLLRAITTLASRVSNKTFDHVLTDIAEKIEGGNTLWQSMANHPKYFNHLFISIVRAGESTGTLTEILGRLADYREKRTLMRRQVKSALAYPFVILIAGLAVLILFLAFVLPEFESLFDNFDIELPAITRGALATAHIIVSLWWLWIAIVVGAIFFIVSYARTPGGRLRVDYWKLKMPIFGAVITKRVVADFSQTFATLLNAGISILETIDLTKEAVGNAAFAKDLEVVRDSIERGEGMEKPLRASKVVPPLMTDMLATGEESGSLERVSRQMAHIYEQEVETSVMTLKSLIEPVMILGLGLLVLFLTLSFFWPYVSIISQVTSM